MDKVAKKPRNLQMPKLSKSDIRKLKSRNAKKTKAAQDLLRREARGVNPDSFNAARGLFISSIEEPTDGGKASELIDQALRTKLSYKLIRASRSKYMQALDLAYGAETMIAGSSADEQKRLLEILVRISGAKLTGRVDLMQLSVRAFVGYEGAEREAQKLWSRDASALKYLRSQNVLPGTILDFQKENKGGLDAWSIAWAAQRRKNEAGKQRQLPEEEDDDELCSFSSMEKRLAKELKEGETVLLKAIKTNGRMRCSRDEGVDTSRQTRPGRKSKTRFKIPAAWRMAKSAEKQPALEKLKKLREQKKQSQRQT
jgi:hypothetical protein